MSARLPNFIAHTANGLHFCLCGRRVSTDSSGHWAHTMSSGDCRRAVNWNANR